MQLHRLQKHEITSTLFGKRLDSDKLLTKSELMQCFKNPPFMFIQKLKIDLFCEFLVQPVGEKSKTKNFSLSIKEILTKLEKLLPE